MPIEIDYSTLRNHESMLRDAVRCRAFRRAIEQTVTPGCAVLDIGAGTGILSLFAAQAGARVVYAVEQTQIAVVAERIIAENGFSDCIKVIQHDMATLELPEKVDVIVSEWLGGYGVDENLLPVVSLARDRWLKPGGKMIPDVVSAWMAPADDEYLQQDVDFWYSEPYGINLDLVGRTTASQMDCTCNHVKQKHLLCEPQLMWETDGMTCSCADPDEPFRCRLTFVAERAGQFNVLAAWFRANLTREIVLSNAPSEPDTHWGRHVFPVGRTLFVERGTRMVVDFALEPKGKGQSRASWSVEVGEYRFQSEGSTILIEP